MTNPNPAAPLEAPGLAAMLTEIVALCDLPVEDMRRLYGSEERVLMAVIPARINAVLDRLTEDRWASGVSIATEALARATSTPAGLDPDWLEHRLDPPDEFSEPGLTHGRHCPCSACAREDWTKPDLAHCGMHGPSCPAPSKEPTDD